MQHRLYHNSPPLEFQKDWTDDDPHRQVLSGFIGKRGSASIDARETCAQPPLLFRFATYTLLQETRDEAMGF